ncbi:MAG: J domain-containing protein [Candidatus Ozemobacteraceae bacterium]
MKNCFHILGVDETASAQDIRKAYLERVKVLHPDRFSRENQPSEWNSANEMLRELNEAYEEVQSIIFESESGNFPDKRYTGPAEGKKTEPWKKESPEKRGTRIPKKESLGNKSVVKSFIGKVIVRAIVECAVTVFALIRHFQCFLFPPILLLLFLLISASYCSIMDMPMPDFPNLGWFMRANGLYNTITLHSVFLFLYICLWLYYFRIGQWKGGGRKRFFLIGICISICGVAQIIFLNSEISGEGKEKNTPKQIEKTRDMGQKKISPRTERADGYK